MNIKIDLLNNEYCEVKDYLYGYTVLWYRNKEDGTGLNKRPYRTFYPNLTQVAGVINKYALTAMQTPKIEDLVSSLEVFNTNLAKQLELLK